MSEMRMDWRAIVAFLSNSPACDSCEIVDPEGVALGEDATALAYRAHAQRAGVDPFVAIMVSAYRVAAHDLKLATYQQRAQSPIDG